MHFDHRRRSDDSRNLRIATRKATLDKPSFATVSSIR
jgi:hypothetical protein